MILSNDMYKDVGKVFVDIIDLDWLTGAITGLHVSGWRSPSWQWDPFIEDIEYMSDMMGGVCPINMQSMKGVQSIFDTLGGYISMTGTLDREGVWFRANPKLQVAIRQWLSGLEVVCSGNDVLIPNVSLRQFIKLIPIRGPVEDQLIQEGRL
jgi:hypothetical protein